MNAADPAPHPARPRALLALLALVTLALGAATASTVHAQDTPLPGADGIATRDWTGSPTRVGSALVTLGLQMPADWNVRADGNTLLFEPEPNPGDLGTLVYFDSTETHTADDLTQPAVALALLDGIVIAPRETARESVTLDQASGPDLTATLLELEARFDNGTPARFLALHVVDGEVVVVALAGAADDVWGPWHATLRDVLLSLQLSTSR